MAVRLICLHKVDTGQKFVCGVNPVEAFALDSHELWKTCARADKNSLVLVLKKLVDGERFADNNIGFDINAERFKGVNLLGDY